MKNLMKVFISFGFLFAFAQAHAVVITFEGFNNTTYGSPITRSGFDIGNVAGDTQHFHELTSTSFGLPNNGTGVLLNDRDSRIFVEDASSGLFSLTSIDVAAALNNLPAIGIQIEGFLNNVSTGIITLASLGNGYTTLLGGSLGSVDRVVFGGLGGAGGFVLDNLSLNERQQPPSNNVSAPGTLALIGLGIIGVGFSRKKKAI